MKGGGYKMWIRKHAYFVIYATLMLGCGVWQLLDWYYGSEDPIWHLLFYIFFMPAFSLSYGFFSEHAFLAPFVAVFLTAFVYIFMANGGFSIDAFSVTDLKSAWELCVPSLATTLVGVIVRKIVMIFG